MKATVKAGFTCQKLLAFSARMTVLSLAELEICYLEKCLEHCGDRQGGLFLSVFCLLRVLRYNPKVFP